MRTAKLGQEVLEDFKVTDSYHDPVTGLVIGDFDIKIYNNLGTERAVDVSVAVQEFGDGNYRMKYTPDIKGMWSAIVRHDTYFP